MLLDRVFQVTGFPVEVQRDPLLTVKASVQSARPGRPVHMIRLNPRSEGQADYWVASECLLLLRMWAIPYEEQRDFRPDEEKKRYLASKTEKLKFYRGQPPELVSEMASRFFTGLLLQLRSFPGEIRVNKTLRQEFPDVDTQQRAGVISVLRENSESLDPKVKAMTPPDVYGASISMNAACAAFWSREWSDSSITLPYEASGFLQKGLRLLAILDGVPDQGGKEDAGLIDAWADVLSIRGWYSWTLKTTKTG